MPRLDALRDGTAVAAELVAAGISPIEAAAKAALTARVVETLLAGGAAPAALADARFVPGRIEVFGKHTDYAGGQSLTCACERGHVFVAVPREDAVCSFTDALSGERVTCAFEPMPEISDPGHWSVYPVTAARRLVRNFSGNLRGIDLVFAGDLPPAAGLSSSTVLITGTWLALAARNGLGDHPEWEEARLSDALSLGACLGAVENGSSFGDLRGEVGVGTQGGCQDSVAILNARPGCVRRFRYGPVQVEGDVVLPAGLVFAVAVSGVVAAKTGAARERYNQASSLAADAAAAWRRATGCAARHLGAVYSAVAGDADAVARAIRVGAGADQVCDLLRRFEHFALESERVVPEAFRALVENDRGALGSLGDASADAADRLLGNQVPETLALARSARELGAIAAAPFGAGFGGSVWALIEAGEGEVFLEAWAKRYRPASSRREPVFFLTGAGPKTLTFGPDFP